MTSEKGEVESDLDLLDVLTRYLCMVVDCSGEVWRPDASDEPLSESVTSRIQKQVASFEAHGVLPGLTDAEKSDGVSNAEQTRDHILDSPGLIEPGLESEYLATLEGMIDALAG